MTDAAKPNICGGVEQDYANLDLMFHQHRFYSQEGADKEIWDALSEIARLRATVCGIQSLCEDHSGMSARMLSRDILELIEGE